MTTATCTACGEDKNITEFPKNGRDKEGQIAYRPDCKICYGIRRKVTKKKHGKFMSSTKHRTGEVGTLSLQDWREAVLVFRGCCAYCGVKQSRKIKLTKEHIIPVVKGGQTVRQNIIPACTACNCAKSDRDFMPWYRQHKSYDKGRLDQIIRWAEMAVMS